MGDDTKITVEHGGRSVETESHLAQLSLDVGGHAPTGVSFKVGGSLAATKELPKGADIHVTINDANGEVICSRYGYVSAVQFKDHRPSEGPWWTERIHSVTVE